jgi:glycerol-3-phosphate dehydrogenase
VSAARGLGLDGETARTCARRHGAGVSSILDRVRADPGLGERIVPDAPFCRAEIVHSACGEMVRSLEDLVRRRMPLVLLSRLAPDTVAGIAALAGEHLGWDEARRADEVAAVVNRYGLSSARS